ncbi:nucleoside kinase [[Clostridium] hylemonae]|uniref:Phosphoribulokinase/uridine kinase family protein n=1 Tax=[Clostridium] hylemonae DSM 15053 TaxID=553973 RepID=C0C3A0_9FIRM|nr:nucleoside kinase [[Clostridium] hylemonae]EEG73276.1 phosphoribulokinase/uridine kinase family protein [[Clostridium] hylemonae DSM 15053]QEK17363.1 Threonine--tRNA ligase 1 [[Clostridium] hylemonae DSM 15053]BDF04369.1 nucleoside kinase [[Clostridium] hylemonae]
MDKEMYSVQIGEEIKRYERGTTYERIAQEYQKDYPYDIVLVFVNGRLQELYKTLNSDAVISFVTTADNIGHKTYKRSMSLMLVKAVYDVANHEAIDKVRIHYAVSKGYYCTIEGDIELNEEFLDKVEARMYEMVEMNMPIQKRSIHTDDAVALFRQHGMRDKERLFEYRRVSKVNIYSMNEFEDYYYGYMVPSAGYLKYFKLYLYDEGFVIQMPVEEAPDIVPPFEPQNKLFQVLKESTKWGDIQGIETVGALNDKITKSDVREVVLVQEAMQEKKIAEIASEIAGRPEIKFVLIAGPSSSGKTTFSHRLSIQLRANGLVPHPIAVDNYFVERENNPKDADGNYDFECLEAVDVELFNRQLRQLTEGKEVIIPNFNFVTGHKEYTNKPKKLGANDVLVIEGIHCLNPKLTEQLADENKYKIYISGLTQLNIDEHNRIPTTDGRLIRRIVRDARTRGSSARRTISMWPSVRRGEEQNIFPFQEEADVMFNSALIYELAVLKPYVEALLFGIEKDCVEYIEAKRLLKFLDYFVGIGSEYVPTNSLLREFIGGGCFNL